MAKKVICRDISAELDKTFGPIGSKSRNKAIQEAWEEYNAQVLADSRKAAKMTQEQLAKKVGTDKSYISKVEHGLIVPSIGMFYRMAAAMGYEVELVKRG